MSVRGHYSTKNTSHDHPFFSANIHFAWCPTERVKEFCGDGPTITQDIKTKKRASGLDLLRPRSSKGQSRFGDPGVPCPTIVSPPPSSPPLPIDWVTVAQTLSPQLFGGDNHVASGSLRPGESKHNKEGSWDVIEELDLFPRSVRSGTKVPITKSRGSFPDETSRAGGWSVATAMQWIIGGLQIELRGHGGRDGGELRIGGDSTACNIIHAIPSIPNAGSRRPPVPQVPAWEISDIQIIHASVLNRPHVLSLRLRSISKPTPTSPLPNGKSNGHAREPRSKTSTGLSGVFGLRARGQTFSGRGSLDIPRAPPLRPINTTRHPNDLRSVSSTYNGLAQAEGEKTDRTIFLCFGSSKEQDDWYNLLRSLAGPRQSGSAGRHRRLSLSIIDLNEAGTRHRGASTDPASSMYTHDRSAEKNSRMSDGETRDTSALDSGSMMSKKGKELKAGWTRKDLLCMELRIDDVVRARTTWTRAASKSRLPFWGEAFHLTDIPSFSTCVLLIYRQSKGKAIKIAIVDLSLVSDISSAKDERYTVKSTADGSVVGELRLAVSYQDIRLLPKDRYAVARIVYPENVDALYDLDRFHSFDGAWDTLARIGVASGHVYSLLTEMIEREARGADSTLFRGNTPLSKLLEATLRILSEDFLKRAIGPTVARLAKEIGTGSLIALTGEPFHEGANRVAVQIEACWADLYAARGSLPEPLKVVLGTLYWAVRHHHASTKERYFPYKAISSFLFLRLINPALIRPHLFGLRSGLYPAGSQKTATLVARVLSAMSFFSPRDAQRDPELALFSDIISSNSEMMLDYLSSSIHQDLDTPEEVIGDTFQFVAARMNHLPNGQADSIPVPSFAGAIDVQAELGVLSAVIAHRREEAGMINVNGQTSRGSAAFVKQLDKNLREVVRASEGNGWRDEDDLDYTDPSDASFGTATIRPSFISQDPSLFHPRHPGIENQPQSPWLAHEYRYDKAKSRPASPLSTYSRPPSPSPSPGAFGRVLESAQRAQHATGALVRRSLSSKRIGRRGSMSRLQVVIPGREADDPGRPKTAKR